MKKADVECFPDGTPIDSWFYDTRMPELNDSDKQYPITDYGIVADGQVHTDAFQRLIDEVAESGGGVIVVPEGTYRTGALFFRQGVDLYLSENGTIMGSDDIIDYPVCQTRIEGQCCQYYPALINADGVDGFRIFGNGTIDGNGSRAWKAFWKRREWNPDCTNKDEQRPRLLFVSNSRNVTISQVRLQNSHFWTAHIYQCRYVKFLGCRFFAPRAPVPAPSSDAIDIDVCSDVLVKNCRMEVNDDSVVLKGGKGRHADTDPGNGINERVLVEDCEYGFCHSALTCGSESVHNRNVLVRRIRVDGVIQLIHFKLRPDTPQCYEYLTVEHVTGSVRASFLNVSAWTQFYKAESGDESPRRSDVRNVTIRDCVCSCDTFFNVVPSENDTLTDFTLRDLQITARDRGRPFDVVDRIAVENTVVRITEED